jgi:hypothetical protein
MPWVFQWKRQGMSSVGLVVGGVGGGQGLSDEGFRWTHEPPVLEARAVEGVEFISVKDPSIVRYWDEWHLFRTVRGPVRTHAIVYLSFGLVQFWVTIETW